MRNDNRVRQSPEPCSKNHLTCHFFIQRSSGCQQTLLIALIEWTQVDKAAADSQSARTKERGIAPAEIKDFVAVPLAQ